MKSELHRNPKAIGGVLLFQGLLMFMPLVILGPAIDWPASLSAPVEEVLPLILEKSTAVTAGYVIYLVYSIVFFPMAVLFSRFAGGGEIDSNAGRIGVGFAALSTLARSLGITRWLTAMPLLARLWSDTPGRDVEAVYLALNALAGGIGEIVGVGIFAGIWVLIVSVTLLKRKTMHPFWGWTGIACGVFVMAPAVELFGLELGGLISVSTGGLHIWWISAGLSLLLGRDARVVREKTE